MLSRRLHTGPIHIIFSICPWVSVKPNNPSRKCIIEGVYDLIIWGLLEQAQLEKSLDRIWAKIYLLQLKWSILVDPLLLGSSASQIGHSSLSKKWAISCVCFVFSVFSNNKINLQQTNVKNYP